MEDPEAVAVVGGKARATPSQPPFSHNEKARRMHVVASDAFKPCVEVMLRGVTKRRALDDKLGRILPFKELAAIFNNNDMEFDNFFQFHEHGDEDLRSLDPNVFKERPESFLKGKDLMLMRFHSCFLNMHYMSIPQINGHTTRRRS